MNNGDKASAPLPICVGPAGDVTDIEDYNPDQLGLTKREHFAGLALQGLAGLSYHDEVGPNEVAKGAVKIADALLKELEK